MHVRVATACEQEEMSVNRDGDLSPGGRGRERLEKTNPVGSA